MAVVRNFKLGETLTIPTPTGPVVVTVLKPAGVKLKIESPPDVRVVWTDNHKARKADKR
jgi:hypothetical protein